MAGEFLIKKYGLEADDQPESKARKNTVANSVTKSILATPLSLSGVRKATTPNENAQTGMASTVSPPQPTVKSSGFVYGPKLPSLNSSKGATIRPKTYSPINTGNFNKMNNTRLPSGMGYDTLMPDMTAVKKKAVSSLPKTAAYPSARLPSGVNFLDPLTNKDPTKPGVGKWIGDNTLAGVAAFNRSLAQTADFILPDVITPKPVQNILNYYKEKDYNRLAGEAAKTNRATNTETLGNLYQSTVAAIPNAALAYMSAGTNLLPQAGTAVAPAAGQAATGLTGTIKSAFSALAKNPTFWSSFAQTVGGSYEQAKEEGAGELEAQASALISSLLNSIVEVGGGIETFGQNGTGVKAWVKSMLDEGKEEVVQGMIENLVRKATYAPDTPYFSNQDQSAVINLPRAGQEFMGGAFVGGALGGAQLGAAKLLNGNAQVQYEPGSEKRYNRQMDAMQDPFGKGVAPETKPGYNQVGGDTNANDAGRAGRSTYSTNGEMVGWKGESGESGAQAGGKESRRTSPEPAGTYIARATQEGKIVEADDFGNIVSYKPAREIGQNASEAQEILRRRGFDSFAYEGTLSRNKDGLTTEHLTDAQTLADGRIGIKSDCTLPGKEIAGHEGFHSITITNPEISKPFIDLLSNPTRPDVISQLNNTLDYMGDLMYGDGYDPFKLKQREKIIKELAAQIGGKIDNNPGQARELFEDLVDDFDITASAWKQINASYDMIYFRQSGGGRTNVPPPPGELPRAKRAYNNIRYENTSGANGSFANAPPPPGELPSARSRSINSAQPYVQSESYQKSQPESKIPPLYAVDPRLNETVSDIKDLGRKAYQYTVSAQSPLERINRMQSENGSATIDAATQMARQAGGTVDFIGENALVDRDGNILGESYVSLMKRIPKGQSAAFNDYMQNLHNIARQAQGKPVNANTAEQSAEIVRRYEQKRPEFKTIGQSINAWWDEFGRKWLVDGGLMSEEAYNHMREMYPNYVPTYRKEKQGGGSGLYGKSVSTPKVVRKAKGGTSEIIPLEESFMQQIDRTVRAERRNELYMELVRAAREYPEEAAKLGIRLSENSGGEKGLIEGLDGFLDNVDTETLRQLKNGGYTLTAYENGNPVTLDLSRDVWNSLQWLQNKGMDNDALKAFVNLGKKLTGPSKMGITGVNALFAVTNTVRDLQTYLVNSISNNPLEMFSNYGKAIADIVTKSDTYKQYQALGGSRSGFYGSQEGYERSVQRAAPFRERSAKQKATSVLGAPFKAMGAIGEFTEKVPRLAEYRNARARYGDTPQGRRAAELAAADVTVNFSRGAPITKAMDAWTMYLNAQVQGLDKMARQIKNKPIATFSKAALISTLPTLLLYLVNRDNPYYDELDNRTKDSYFVIPNLSETDEQGNAKTFFRLPRSREYGALLGASFDRVARYMETGDAKNSFRDFGNTVATNILPSNPLVDNFLGPLFINLPNNRDFAGRSIVPQSMANLSPQYQYDINTSGIARKAGETFGVSPKQADYLISSLAGYPGQLLQALSSPQNEGDNILETAGNAFRRAAVQPFERRFTADPRYQSAIIDQFYADYDEARKAVADKNFSEGIPSGAKTPEDVALSYFNKISSQISDLRKQEKEVLASKASYSEKQAQTDALREQMNALARSAKEGAQAEQEAYRKIYVPEISELSDSRQEQARELFKQGISYEQFNRIYEKYKAIDERYDDYSGDESRSVKKATEFSKYLDGLNLTSRQRAAVDESFKFYNMFPAQPQGYRIGLMSESAQEKYPLIKSRLKWDEEKYVKYYPIATKQKKKAEILKDLRDAGLTSAEAAQFYNIIKSK